MTILFHAEFNQQSTQGSNPLERIYQGIPIERGPAFPIKNLTIAQAYCHRFSSQQHGRMCIIVREENFLRVWSEVTKIEASSVPGVKFTLSKSKKATAVDSLPVQAEFVDFCQKLLAEQIGPIAGMICKKALAKNPNLTRAEFVAVLAKKISDPTLAQKFQQATLQS
jgi:hypothetical protein